MEVCFQELRNFNDRGEFLGKHPFIAQRTERERVEQVLRENPTAFLDEMKNIEGNVSRYGSHVRSGRYTGDRLRKEQENLDRYTALRKMYQEILENTIRK